MNRAAIILLMEVLGAALVTAGIGLVFPPAALVAAGIFILVFAIAVERSRA
jgi:hypothetical protein